MLFLLSTSALSLQNLFLQFDADKSGTMSSYELRTALKAAGKENLGCQLQADCRSGTVCGSHLPLMAWKRGWTLT